LSKNVIINDKKIKERKRKRKEKEKEKEKVIINEK